MASDHLRVGLCVPQISPRKDNIRACPKLADMLVNDVAFQASEGSRVHLVKLILGANTCLDVVHPV